MDTLSAFAMGMANRGELERVFDWDKAARLIKEYKAIDAQAGLDEDWEWTGGSIFKDGKPDLEDYAFLSSTWATPVLVIDGKSFECYVMEDQIPEQWIVGCIPASVRWPASALEILNE